MARRSTRGYVALVLVFTLMLLPSLGCLGTRGNGPRSTGTILVPPPGTVPNELSAITLPEYVIEPPDVLQIEAVMRKVKTKTDADKDKDKDIDKAKDKETEKDKPKEKAEPKKQEAEPKKQEAPVFTDDVDDLPIHPIRQQFQVQPDGFVHLGAYGSVPVSGLTVNQTRLAIRAALAKQIDINAGGRTEDSLIVIVSVVQYNSKVYYVHADGGGAGERVYKLPITGKEFVSDAIANIGGLPVEASKRNIWVARRTPELNEQQILPVDWVGISQWGVASTNYQIFPGDRVYVKAQRLVTVNTTLSRILEPVQQIFGVTLLGTQTVNQLVGRGIGFNGTANP